MLAARWYGRRDIRVEDIPAPGAPPPGWVRLQVECCGLCGTDLEEYTAGPLNIPTRPHPLTGRMAPLTLGHEIAGIVDEAGAGVELESGARVAVEGSRSCGTCRWCRQGDLQLCPVSAQLGLHADGGLAEQVLTPAAGCVPVEPHVPAVHAALAEPLSVVVRAVRRSGLEPGASVGVLGTGSIGMLLLQVARTAGADTVVAVERHADRRLLGLKFGADVVVAPEEAEEALADLTGGTGIDVVFEAAGTPQATTAAVRLARRGGTAVLLGGYPEPARLDIMDLLGGEKRVIASLSHVITPDFADAVSLINRGKLELDPLISDRIGLPDVVKSGFDALLDAPAGHLKIMVGPARRR
jgi:(R,R)-butanediol dehydrogenase / meso-butanediol dehydrogenase / diacetyl reductase